MNTNLDLEKIKKVHFIGIGGIGISAIARMMAFEGKKVTGNDLGEFELVTALRAFGVDTKIGSDSSVIPKDAELIIYSIAWNTLAPELLEYVKSIGIPMLSYPEILGILSKERFTIAISGTHGKTTTTGMVAKILIDAGLDPTVIIGSLIKNDKGQLTNFIPGKSKYLVIEACEYKRSFLNYYPQILVITNIDNDHLDYYKDIMDIQSAFNELAKRIPQDGAIVADKNNHMVMPALKDTEGKIVNYTLYNSLPITLKVPGIHNKKNAAAAFAVATALGIDPKVAQKALEAFPGTWRRFEYLGETEQGTRVYDDYGHHPTEIKATIQGARELYPRERLIVAFQPHLYSRTKLLLDEFAGAFTQADEVVLAPIYAAREVDDGTVSSELLKEKISAQGTYAVAFPDLQKTEDYLRTQSKKGDVIIMMGAGDIYKIGENIVK